MEMLQAMFHQTQQKIQMTEWQLRLKSNDVSVKRQPSELR